MTDNRRWQDSVRELSRHFPPSGAQLHVFITAFGKNLRLGDIASTLHNLRPDLLIVTGEQPVDIPLQLPSDSQDAFVVCDLWQLGTEGRIAFLSESIRALRPGGRLLLLDATATNGLARLLHPSTSPITLEAAASALAETGFARVLAERLADDAAILSRGEKPYSISATVERIAQSAARGASAERLQTIDSGSLPGASRGRFVFILVRQTPDKPAWAIQPGEKISWQAQMVNHTGEGGKPYLLLFSSLPKAVSFMQAAVMAGQSLGVNKVAK